MARNYRHNVNINAIEACDRLAREMAPAGVQQVRRLAAARLVNLRRQAAGN